MEQSKPMAHTLASQAGPASREASRLARRLATRTLLFLALPWFFLTPSLRPTATTSKTRAATEPDFAKRLGARRTVDVAQVLAGVEALLYALHSRDASLAACDLLEEALLVGQGFGERQVLGVVQHLLERT